MFFYVIIINFTVCNVKKIKFYSAIIVVFIIITPIYSFVNVQTYLVLLKIYLIIRKCNAGGMPSNRTNLDVM